MPQDPLRYKLPQNIHEAHLEIINQARQADEAEKYVLDHPLELDKQNNQLYDQNRMLRAENRSLKIALAEALRPPDEKLALVQARLEKLEDALRKALNL